MSLESKLDLFDSEQGISGSKGALSIILVLTRQFADASFPLDAEDFVTREGGQVKGVGKTAVQKILADHGITRILAEEAGRTSRGSLGKMKAYITLANEAQKAKGWNAKTAEAYWIGKVSAFFAAKPFRMKIDPAKSVRAGLNDLFSQIEKRQRESSGTMFGGTVFQHLVGAKVEIVLGKPLPRHAHSTADAPTGRAGDFIIDGTVIHVTTSPGEALIRKCRENLDAGLMPIVVTGAKGCTAGEVLAGDQYDRIEFIDIAQFLTANIHEWGRFRNDKRREALSTLIARYNEIVEACERSPGLTIEVA